jgi:uncharacterized protein YkwD
MRLALVLAAISAATLCACTAETTARAPSSAAPPIAAVPSAPPEEGIAGLLNGLRGAAGLAPATWDSRLAAAAQAHADDMRRNAYFSHMSRDGRDIAARIAQAGFRACGAAENIAHGQASEAAAFRAWAGSAPHLANMRLSGRPAWGFGRNGDIHVLTLARPC